MANSQFRLVIGSPAKRQSGIWRVWSNSKGDIYVANRCLGGIFKASFHKDRRCQFGFTKEYSQKAKERFSRDDRHLEKWVLPKAIIVRAVQILIPEPELRETVVALNKKITWLKTPPPGEIGTISLFIAEKNVDLTIPPNPRGGVIVGTLETEIRRAWITYAFTIPDEILAKRIELEKHRLIATIASKSIPPSTRASLWDSKSSHERHVLELACDVAG